MQQIDLEPTGYRKQDRETGRWVQNVNKPMCRNLGITVMGLVAYMGWLNYAEGGLPFLVPAVAGLSFAAGGLIVLSAKSIDW